MEIKIMERITKELEMNKKVALAVITEVKGASPGKIGTMMAVFENGETLGTVGGGNLEHVVINESLKCLNEGLSKEYEYRLENDEGSLHMECGGSVKVFIKSFVPKDKLLIVGAGHVGQSIYKFSELLGFNIIVFDDREEFANKENFPKADGIILGDIKESLLKYPVDENTYVIIVTRGHNFDEEALESVIYSKAKYIGMIGSKNKVKTIINNLKNKGIEEKALKKVYAPVGIKLGGSTPIEVALSIISEMMLIKNNGKLIHMRDTIV
ncbi:XdhC family protein [Clostridium tetanomorphum]|uniref:Xanthine dehydrogenase n=1 Tax=Clostridium tetanomorphum TaxID=1553 RepID=A0A923E893_CLOTT|nr:XdhC/CoxI family protein [Clostridium tetanomorphum]MBC2397072.1 xanthine dehydrogenase [Clostridium tetanomorphum]NRZ99084.1 xanthine dehydrogenase accessory factor [Clostridium tetanomorphum]